MKRGEAILCGAAVLALAACAADKGRLEIRSTKSALPAGERPVPVRIAEGWAQLNLGNVGLALESFRKANREDPQSTLALLGIAASYDRMGRYDLSRRNYEAALALDPADPSLLAALASSLDRQGRKDEAASVRREIALRSAASARPEPVRTLPAPPAPVETVRMAKVEPSSSARQLAPAELPPPVQAVPERPLNLPARPPQALASPAPAPAPATAALPPMRAATAPAPNLQIAALPPASVSRSLARAVAEAPVAKLAVKAPDIFYIPAPYAPPRVASDPVSKPVEAELAVAPPVPTVSPVPLPQSEPAASVTVKLPPPRPAAAPAQLARAERTAASPLPPVRRNMDGPRVERLSLSEVAIVTAAGPRWTTQSASSNLKAVRQPRFVALRQEPVRARVRLLNAARVHRLAARTRAYLYARGWREIGIGDAESTRGTSIVYYPVGEKALAKRLSAQFGFAMAQSSEVSEVTVLLGRDSRPLADRKAGG